MPQALTDVYVLWDSVAILDTGSSEQVVEESHAVRGSDPVARSALAAGAQAPVRQRLAQAVPAAGARSDAVQPARRDPAVRGGPGPGMGAQCGRDARPGVPGAFAPRRSRP